MVQYLWKTVWQFISLLNVELPYDSIISFLYAYFRELTPGHTKPSTEMFMAALFIITKK